jgi:hypothetical protein
MGIMRLFVRMRRSWNNTLKHICGPFISALLTLECTGNAMADGVTLKLMFCLIFMRCAIWHFHLSVKRVLRIANS